jgi:transketolase
VSTFDWSDRDRRAVDPIRVLAIDAVERAGSGHPGTAMSRAPAMSLAPATSLAPDVYLLHATGHAARSNGSSMVARDRFVPSCGHTSLNVTAARTSLSRAGEPEGSTTGN